MDIIILKQTRKKISKFEEEISKEIEDLSNKKRYDFCDMLNYHVLLETKKKITSLKINIQELIEESKLPF